MSYTAWEISRNFEFLPSTFLINNSVSMAHTPVSLSSFLLSLIAIINTLQKAFFSFEEHLVLRTKTYMQMIPV